MLLAMPMLTASPEMKEVAIADEPKKEKTYWGHTRMIRKYRLYMNCVIQDGILRAATISARNKIFLNLFKAPLLTKRADWQ